IAVCKVVLQIDPQHADTLRRLALMNEQVGAGPTRAGGMAENNPALHDSPYVAAIRRGSSTQVPPLSSELRSARGDVGDRGRARPSTPPAISFARTKSRPIALPPGAALETVNLSKEVPESHPRDSSSPGVHVIPLDVELLDQIEYDAASDPVIEIEPPDAGASDAEVDEATELDLEDIEEIPLPAPRAIGMAAQRALAATPLFAGLPSDALEALVENLSLVPLESGETLFREGDPGDALYVVVEGEVSVLSEGPPLVEMSRLGPGSFLGEVSLITDQPRTATVTASQTSELLRIDRVTLSRVLANHGDVLRAVLRFVRDRLVDRWMRTSPLFRPFDQAQRAELAGKFTFLEIEDGTLLIGAGMRPDGLYIVLGGQFVVHRSSRTVAILGPGDLIGETALLSGGAFRSDVIAHGKSLALCLPAARFREVIMTHPHVLEYIGEQAEHSRRLQIL
ncbi:MAG: cyclic nucleotide-binding domain-containing protein, partial [Kofleriaceae bacterium]